MIRGMDVCAALKKLGKRSEKNEKSGTEGETQEEKNKVLSLTFLAYCVSQKKRAPTYEVPSNKFCFKEGSYIHII